MDVDNVLMAAIVPVIGAFCLWVKKALTDQTAKYYRKVLEDTAEIRFALSILSREVAEIKKDCPRCAGLTK